MNIFLINTKLEAIFFVTKLEAFKFSSTKKIIHFFFNIYLHFIRTILKDKLNKIKLIMS